MTDLEVWGGHEFTVNRVGGAYFDQTLLSGHQERPDDLERFAALGLQALRYPALWERICPDRADLFDWSWTDERLPMIREFGMRPIVSLVHHGGGPRYTSLVETSFAPGLAAFARATAERYPWIEDWTPVNEPLTTARFSALYGHWYPHLADEAFFWLALLNQIDGVRLSMAEIRKVNPAARLIQTEDLGRTSATPAVASQAAFDNARRWMTWDLLAGRVDPAHSLWARLAAYGLADRLRAIADAPCPADVIGVNHYLTSDRFLDDRLGRYPEDSHGGNDQMAYADVEAIRVLTPAPGGLEAALGEAWLRYKTPVAVTECYNGCTREEQVRWLTEAWATAQHLRARGVPVEAVTAWSLLGAFDWNSLLTRQAGHYEVGAFDVRGPSPRPTALARAITGLRGACSQPPVEGPGWWRRDVRLQFEPVFRAVGLAEARPSSRTVERRAQPILILGATGSLGRTLARACEWRGLDYVLTGRPEVDVRRPQSLDAAICQFNPWAVINASGWVKVDEAEREQAACLEVNALGAAAVARSCLVRGLPNVSFSSDLVFDGLAERPYIESDAPNPLNVYGVSKAEAEREILQLGGQSLIVRTAAFFSSEDPYNFAAHVVRALDRREALPAAADLFVSPTYLPDLVDAVLDLLIDGESGLWHLANEGATSWAGFATLIAKSLGLDAGLIVPTQAHLFGWAARRPAYAPLGSERGRTMPSLESAVARYAASAGDARPPAEIEGEGVRSAPHLLLRGALATV